MKAQSFFRIGHGILVLAAVVALVMIVFSGVHDQQSLKAADFERARQLGRLEGLRDADQAVEAQRKDVIDHPAKYLRFEDFQWEDRGIVNSYRTLTDVTITNLSPFMLRIDEATLSWLDGSALVGATLVHLSGDIAAGDTRHYSKSNGTLESPTIAGALDPGLMNVSKAQIVGPPDASIAQARAQ